MPGWNKMDKSEQKQFLAKFATLLSLIAGCAVVACFIFLGLRNNVEVQQSRVDVGYTGIQDYSCREIESTDAPIGIIKEYTFSVTDAPERDLYLAFYTVHQCVDVYLDGEKLYSLHPAQENSMIKTVGSNWVMIPLYREDAGKEIRVEITPVYESFRNREVEFLIGSQLEIYRKRLVKDLPQLILGIMAVFVGIIFICVAWYSVVKKNRGKRIVALGIFSAMLGFWRLTDTRFTPFILPDKPLLLFYISVTMLMLGMIPLVKFVEDRLGGLGRKSYVILDSYCIGMAGLCLIQLLLQFAGIRDLRENLFLTHIAIGAGIILILGIVLYNRIKYPQRQTGSNGRNIALFCVLGVLADIALYYIKGNSSGLLFTLLAFLICIVSMGIATMFHYSEQEIELLEKDRLLAENERKLTESKVTAMMGQIRTHFIFNILNAISGYCKYDAKKADEVLLCFSRYLRRNMKMLEEDEPVPFTKELEYLEDYVKLEQIRFGEKIQFVTEPEVQDFKLPPMVLQPIVENSIKHGILGKNDGGSIWLYTKRDTDQIMITVRDDGVGFEPDSLQKEDSVGLKNVRFRLEYMMNGKLEIKSSLGEGTTVTIRLPYPQKRYREEEK